MIEFEDLVFKPHSLNYFGDRATQKFPNGYKVSVINGEGATKNKGRYDIAFRKGGVDFMYLEGRKMGINGDIVQQTPEEITSIMVQIQEM